MRTVYMVKICSCLSETELAHLQKQVLAEQFAVMVTSVIPASKLCISGQCHSSDLVNKLRNKQKKKGEEDVMQ